MEKLTERERIALLGAIKNPGGWGLFYPKTTDKLAERGFFEKARHPVYNMRWRITEAGRAALAADEQQ